MTTTIRKLNNLLDNQEKRILASQFVYDKLEEVFEVVLFAPVTTDKSYIEVPLRIYPTERQRAITGALEALLELENIAQVTQPLGDNDYLEVTFTITDYELSYETEKAPNGLLETLYIKTFIGEDKDVPILLGLTFSENKVIGVHSLFMHKVLAESVLAQYLYNTFVGKYDRTPKFIRAVSGSIEARLYPDNRTSNVTLIGDNLVVRGRGESTLGFNMRNLTGEVTITQEGYLVTLSDSDTTAPVAFIYL